MPQQFCPQAILGIYYSLHEKVISDICAEFIFLISIFVLLFYNLCWNGNNNLSWYYLWQLRLHKLQKKDSSSLSLKLDAQMYNVSNHDCISNGGRGLPEKISHHNHFYYLKCVLLILLMFCPPLTKNLFNIKHLMTFDVFFIVSWMENKSKRYTLNFLQQTENWEAIARDISVKGKKVH